MASSNRTSRIKEVERRIIDVSEVDPYTRILAFGPNKKGKTRFAATGPHTLVIDVNERGTKSVASYPGVKVFQAANWIDCVYAYWYLKAANHSIETVAIDTVTQMQHVCMKHVLKEAEDRDPNRDPHTPSQREWLKMAELMRPLILNFRNLPMHCVFVVQERSIDNEDGENERVPDLSPGVRGTVMASVDVIGRVFQAQKRVIDKETKKEKKIWVPMMLIGPHDRYPTGNRLGLPPIMQNPTMQKFINLKENTNG